MNWKTTWMLVALSLGLLVYIGLFERSSLETPAAPRLVEFQPERVRSIQLRRTNEFILRADRNSNDLWDIVSPSFYPAQSVAIEQLLVALSMATANTEILMDELGERQQTIADFGLDVPLADLTLELDDNAGRIHLSFGTKTAVGDNVYLRLSQPGIYVVPANLFDKLPATSLDWRDPRLLDLANLKLDHMEVRSSTGGYEIRIDSTNNVYFISKPTFARADFARVRTLLGTIQSALVSRFVTDNPRAELEPYGLHPPTLEVGFGFGTNDSVIVQFGTSPPNSPDLVYARRLAQTNVVLVPKSIVDALQVSPNELRDRRLLTFSPAAVTLVDVAGHDPFSVQLEEDGRWMVQANPSYLGDAELIRRWIMTLASLEGVVEKDVVTDLGRYGLADPSFQYILKTAVTNATGDITNRVIDQLDLGALDPEKVFVRRHTENSVYSIARAEFDRLPTAAWQLRDRRVWSFTTNDIKSVTLFNSGKTHKLVRGSSGAWSFAPGSTGILNAKAAAEAFERLSQLRAEVWVERGAEKQNLYGITENSRKVTFELDKNGATQTVSIQFGAIEEGHSPYALATVDNQSWILEVPLELYVQIRLSLFPAITP